MRLFIGVRLDESMLLAAQSAARQLQRRIGGDARIRWLTGENMHITVRFIGNVAEGRVDAVMAALRASLAIAPFEIVLGACGVFPPSGPPRVIWIGLASGLPSLRTMHEEFDRRLAPLGFEPESRAFTAHLTLARITDAPRRATKAIRDAVQAVVPAPARYTVASATVFESRLSPRGATYLPLFDVPCMA